MKDRFMLMLVGLFAAFFFYMFYMPVTVTCNGSVKHYSAYQFSVIRGIIVSKEGNVLGNTKTCQIERYWTY